MRYLPVAILVVLLGPAQAAWACATPTPQITSVIEDIVSGDQEAADAAIIKLRDQGPDGLLALVTHYQMRQVKSPDGSMPATSEELIRLKGAIDLVGGQRDCALSQLYWYTDLEAAKQESRQSQRPILSLRLLGKLTDEFSCANSRFFRTTLYANTETSAYLRTNFVLHWQSVRPVPRVTIDFGDGRKLERTLTGNSIHYVLDSDGRAIDALPGLYGPKAFLRGLVNALQAHQALLATSPDRRDAVLIDYHRQRIAALGAAWQNDIRQLGRTSPDRTSQAVAETPQARLAKSSGPNAPDTPAAATAAPRAVAKGVVEVPLIAAMAFNPLADPRVADDEELWRQLAQLHAADAKLDEASVEAMRAKMPTARRAGAVAISKRKVEDPLLRVVLNFQATIALDTVRNEYLLHRQLHDWFVTGKASKDVNVLNERVYAELFLTPSADPWLGLVAQDTYTAIENDGRVTLAKP